MEDCDVSMVELVTEKSVDEIVKGDLEQATKALKDLRSHTQNTLTSVDAILTRLNDDFQTAEGLSFLDVKNKLMLSYLIDLTYVLYRKCSGSRIQEEPAVDRLAETRTVLEKMRPIDQKLKYQIDKLIRTVNTNTINPSDPLRFRANPANLLNKLETTKDSGSEENSDSPDEEKKPKHKSKAYVPPKLSAVHYEGDETQQEKRQRLLDRARKRALSSNIMQELRREYDDGPEEIKESQDLHRVREDKRRRDKNDYEETYMTRLMITRQEKHRSRQMANMSSLAELAHFEDISALEANPEDFPLKKKKVMKQGSKYKKKGKKVFKKKKF